MGYIVAVVNRDKYTFKWRTVRSKLTYVYTTSNVYDLLCKTLAELFPESKNGYGLTIKEVHAIFTYIETHRGITPDIIRNILIPDIRSKSYERTLYTIKHQWNRNELVKFRYQRKEIPEQIEQIKTYILENYMMPSFSLNTLLVCKNDNGIYEILDGMHRCLAISQIPDDEPCLKQPIRIECHMCNNIADKLRLFKSINLSKPIAHAEITEEEINHIRSEVKSMILTNYGNVLCYDARIKSVYTDRMYSVYLYDLLTCSNLNTLLNCGKITTFEPLLIFKYIEMINDKLTKCFRNTSQQLFINECKLDGESIAEIANICYTINNTKITKERLAKFEKVANDIRLHKKPFVLGYICPKMVVGHFDTQRSLTDILAKFDIIEQIYESLSQQEN